MAIKVDPFVIPIPRKILEDHDSRVYFEYLNNFLHGMWVRTGGGTDLIDAASSDANRKSSSLLLAVLEKVNLGDDLTTDTTGFMADNTNFTVDMTES